MVLEKVAREVRACIHTLATLTVYGSSARIFLLIAFTVICHLNPRL
jgi:hypothetical protein